jgi:hypothetical protein
VSKKHVLALLSVRAGATHAPLAAAAAAEEEEEVEVEEEEEEEEEVEEEERRVRDGVERVRVGEAAARHPPWTCPPTRPISRPGGCCVRRPNHHPPQRQEQTALVEARCLLPGGLAAAAPPRVYGRSRSQPHQPQVQHKLTRLREQQRAAPSSPVVRKPDPNEPHGWMEPLASALHTHRAAALTCRQLSGCA